MKGRIAGRQISSSDTEIPQCRVTWKSGQFNKTYSGTPQGGIISPIFGKHIPRQVR